MKPDRLDYRDINNCPRAAASAEDKAAAGMMRLHRGMCAAR